MPSEKFSSNEVEKVLRMKGDSFEVVELPKFADISVAFDQRDAFLDLFEAELKLDPNLTERPDEWFDTSLRSYVEEAVEEPQDVFRFFDLQKRESRIMEELDRRNHPDEEPLYSPRERSDIAMLLLTISPEVVAKAFSSESEDGELHTEALRALQMEMSQRCFSRPIMSIRSRNFLVLPAVPLKRNLEKHCLNQKCSHTFSIRKTLASIVNREELGCGKSVARH
jgi:hypothetical protein